MRSPMSRADLSETLSRSVRGGGIPIVSMERTPTDVCEHAGRTLACHLIQGGLNVRHTEQGSPDRPRSSSNAEPCITGRLRLQRQARHRHRLIPARSASRAAADRVSAFPRAPRDGRARSRERCSEARGCTSSRSRGDLTIARRARRTPRDSGAGTSARQHNARRARRTRATRAPQPQPW
jgi:hypothetical protein